MRISGRKGWSEVLFHLLFSLHCIMTILIDTMIPVTGTAVKLVRVVILLGLMAVLFLNNEFLGIRYIFFGIFTGAVTLLAVFWSGQQVILITLLFILAARGLDFRKICFNYLISAGGITALTVLLCLCGVLEDYTYPHGADIAHSLGFGYYSTLPFLLFIFQLVWMYVRAERVSWTELAVMLAANYVFYKLFTVRLTFLLGVGAVFLFIVMIKLPIFDPSGALLKWAARLGYSALLGFILWLSVSYNAESTAWQTWNVRLNNRLLMLHEAFLRFPFSLKGNRFGMVGQAFVVNGGALNRDYFYIDSGMGYSVFAYGLLFTLLIVVFYTYLYTAAGRNRDRALYVWISVMLLFTFMNNIWIDLAYNPLLLAVVPMLEKEGLLRRAV